MKTLYLVAMVAALGLASCEKKSETPAGSGPAGTAPKAVAPNNTGVNTRDRDAGAMTAGTAGQSKSEVDLAAQIRKHITDTKMSVDAQNVKVVVQGEKVTLRGPVKSQEEKDAVAKIAGDVAGAANVDNQLEVAAGATTTTSTP